MGINPGPIGPEGGQDTFVTAGLVTNGPYPVDTLNFADVPNSLPNINVVIPPSQLGHVGLPQGHRQQDEPRRNARTRR